MDACAFYSDLPTVETPRVLLRKMALTDAPDVFAYASDPEVTRYLPWDTHTSIAETMAHARRTLEQYVAGAGGSWVIEHKRDRKVIGSVEYRLSLEHRKGELGYVLCRAYWGQGIMTDVLRTLIAFGFEQMGLNRVEATCDERNIGSWRAMEKAGMRLEGVQRQNLVLKGELRSTRLYAALRAEWIKEPQGISQNEANKSIVVDYYNLAFNQKRPEDAVARHMGATYKQHSPGGTDNPQGLIRMVREEVNAGRLWKVEIKRVIAEGDYVVLHSHLLRHPGDRGVAVVDIYRLESGKIVEHWDVAQEVPERSANTNTMF
jgi:ribosomal-protein-alanine N-acetyltransferase